MDKNTHWTYFDNWDKAPIANLKVLYIESKAAFENTIEQSQRISSKAFTLFSVTISFTLFASGLLINTFIKTENLQLGNEVLFCIGGFFVIIFFLLIILAKLLDTKDLIPKGMILNDTTLGYLNNTYDDEIMERSLYLSLIRMHLEDINHNQILNRKRIRTFRIGLYGIPICMLISVSLAIFFILF